MASKLYGFNAAIIIFVFVLFCIVFLQDTKTTTTQDAGRPEALSSSKYLLVSLYDSKQEKIEFSQERYEESIEENNPPGVALMRVEVVDYSESPGTVQKRWFELKGGGGRFSINSSTGLVLVEKRLDREDSARHHMQLMAFERRTNVKANKSKNSREPQIVLLSCTASIIVRVTDANDNPPVFSNPVFSFSVTEEKGILPRVAGTVTARDVDLFPNNQFVFKLSVVTAIYFQSPHRLQLFDKPFQSHHPFESDEIISKKKTEMFPSQQSSLSQNERPSDFFQLNNRTGELQLIKLLDREHIVNFNFVIEVIDSSNPLLKSSCTVQVKVHDINDNAPTFLFPNATHNTIHVSTPLRVGEKFGQVEAVDVDEGLNGQVTYQLKEILFKLHPQSGSLSLLRPLSKRDFNKTFLLTITVHDSGQPMQQNSTILVVSFQPAPPLSSFLSKLLYSKRFHNDILPTFVVCLVTLIIIGFLLVAIFKISRQKSFNHVIDSKKQTISPSNVTFISQNDRTFLQKAFPNEANSFKTDDIKLFNFFFSKFQKNKKNLKNHVKKANEYLEDKSPNYGMNSLKKATPSNFTFANNTRSNSPATIALSHNFSNNYSMSNRSILISNKHYPTHNDINTFKNNSLFSNPNSDTFDTHNSIGRVTNGVGELEVSCRNPTIKLLNNHAANSIDNASKSPSGEFVSKKNLVKTDGFNYGALKENGKKSLTSDNNERECENNEKRSLSNIFKPKKACNLKKTDCNRSVTTVLKNGKLFNELSKT